jgi:catechol 2,3-dioxygenase-like lactoylglutathione lyase family enzyme
MTVKRMDNVGIMVEDLDAAIEFFTELGLELEGRAPVEGDTYASCSPWRTSTIRSPDSADAVLSSLAKWSSVKTGIGFATSGVPKKFSAGSPNSSSGRLPERIP